MARNLPSIPKVGEKLLGIFQKLIKFHRREQAAKEVDPRCNVDEPSGVLEDLRLGVVTFPEQEEARDTLVANARNARQGIMAASLNEDAAPIADRMSANTIYPLASMPAAESAPPPYTAAQQSVYMLRTAPETRITSNSSSNVSTVSVVNSGVMSVDEDAPPVEDHRARNTIYPPVLMPDAEFPPPSYTATQQSLCTMPIAPASGNQITTDRSNNVHTVSVVNSTVHFHYGRRRSTDLVRRSTRSDVRLTARQRRGRRIDIRL